jgi:hypothetical protein
MRTGETGNSVPAVARHMTVGGKRLEKFARLETLMLDDPEWEVCLSGWTDRFTPGSSTSWTGLPLLGDLFPWSSPGISPHRTWPSAPDPGVLRARWDRMVGAPEAERSELFRETRDTQLSRKRQSLPGHPHDGVFDDERGSCPALVRYAVATLDRQWLVPDARLINDPRPPIWRSLSDAQVFISELHTEALKSGPALTFTAHVPSLHHFKGSEGGRVLPLWRNGGATEPNVLPGLLDHLAKELGTSVQAEDLVAYTAGIAAHAGYTDLFRLDLAIPGVRIPLTRDPGLWAETVEAGAEIIWLYTFGERFTDPAAGRPAGPPRLPASE